MKEILPTKRFDENFKEVKHKPNPSHYDKGVDNALYQKHEQTYNQAQQRKVLVPLSEFVKLTRFSTENEKDLINQLGHIDDYTNHITQPITEKSLEGVECVVNRYGLVYDVERVTKESSYPTIEHAINDGVLFILKD